jgi:hypothetical protein
VEYIRNFVRETHHTELAPDQVCPHCGHTLELATAASDPGSTPSPGDLTICGFCGELLRFDAELRVHELTAEERVVAEAEPGVQDAQAVIRYMQRHENPPG